MAADKQPDSFDSFDARLDKARQQEAAPRRRAAEAEEPSAKLNWGSGLQVGIEILAGVGGGLLIGWALDRWLGTAPLFIIVFFLLGAAAGLLNAWRHLRRLQAEQDRR